MAISFAQISLSSRLPGFEVEFDNSHAVKGLALDATRVVMFAQKLPAGTAPANIPTRVLAADHGVKLGGRGSMLAAMARAFRNANSLLDLWVVALEDNAAGTKAAGSITVTGPATSASTRSIWIGGTRVQYAVALGATATQVAADLADAINSNLDLVVTATVDGTVASKVNLTARHKGEAFNGLDVRLGYYQNDIPDDGLSFTVAPLTGGAGNPDLVTGMTALGDVQYHHAVLPYTDTANLVAVTEEFTDRWSAGRQIEGQVWSAHAGDHAALTTLGNSLNGFALSIMPTYASPTPAYIWAAVYGAVSAASIDIDPARPLQTLHLKGVLAPAEKDRFDKLERNLLLWDGISTFVVDQSGRCLIERAVTTYQVNDYGLPDPSYLDVETPATLSVLRRTWRARQSQKFPRHKLANDGTNFGVGQAIVTPSILKAENIALARDWEQRGWVENVDAFKEALVVERNADDQCRADHLLQPDLVNQYRKGAALIQFIV
jgi:phage tail sheath gpL-like